ncbi:MAG: precorrin-3B C(17)-methyltransferase [Actinophytocola sp.]|uniref:SecDF P1 head subdomain-containing protein n=1 Tax=Actinophytocola sp. TaxID=1872138 RepID=UPI0013210D55|nr:precorrin-3B C(17)-methyltransferase [Actinophytocola sp.]MPZ86059.1 precorrin-3B C(17)-methyltransferase [Actinophytocola sp.]
MRHITFVAAAALLLACAACTAEVAGAGQSGTSGATAPEGDPDALRFRPVLRSAPISGTPTAGAPTGTAPTSPPPTDATPTTSTTPTSTPNERQRIDPDDPAAAQAALAALDCASPDPLAGEDDAALPLLTCDEEGETAYLLGPSFLTGTDITEARAEAGQYDESWVLNVAFSESGTKAWADFTAANVGKQVAIVLDTTVLSAPQIQEAIAGGSTQISGNPTQFTRDYVEDLADRLGG